MVETMKSASNRIGRGWIAHVSERASTPAKLTKQTLSPAQMACEYFVTFARHLWPRDIAAGPPRPYLRALT